MGGIQLLAVGIVLVSACHGVKPLELPRVGTEVARDVPLNVLLELELFTRSDCKTLLGCPGPYRPDQVDAECEPADRCKVLVSNRTNNPHTLLSIAGLSTGPAKVNLRYRQPGSSEWLNAQLSLNFREEEHLPALVLGSRVPKGSARLNHLGPALQTAGFHVPARCEPTDEFLGSFVCFGIDGSTGVQRFPSCASTPRCNVTDEPPHDGFTIDLDWKDGAISTIKYHASRDGVHEVTETWQLEGKQELHGR